jgi:lysozyme
MDMTKFISQIMIDEGLRLHPYLDTVGKTTIGYGRNLTDNGISEVEAIDLLQHDIDKVMEMLPSAIPFWAKLSDARQRVLANMCFNMGLPTLLSFKKMLAYLKINEYELAAHEMENSLWYKQVGGRAVRLTVMMRTGKDV